MRLGSVSSLFDTAAYIGAAPAAVVSLGSLSWWTLPLGLAAGLVALLWGISNARALIPPRPADAGLVAHVSALSEEVSAAVGIAAPRVFVSTRVAHASVSVAATPGCLVFPELWIERLSADQLRATVAHEVAHLTQAGMRILGRRRMLVISANVVLTGLAAFCAASLPHDGFQRYHTAFVLYGLLPLVLTALLRARRVRYRSLGAAMEIDADARAVAWGTPPRVMADALQRWVEMEREIHQPLDTRILEALLAPRSNESLQAERLARLREASSPAQVPRQQE